MGVKFLSFHMIPWYCFFNNMGGHISCVHPSHPRSDNGIYSGKTAADSRTVKLIRADGRVTVYHRPIMAGELMLEFPKHLICHADSFFIGQKVPPLSETDRLKLGHKYFLLPRQFFQSVLTFVTIASFASVDNEASSSSKKKEMVKKLAATCKPFDIQKSPSGSMQIRVSDEFISKLMEEGRARDDEESDQDSMLDVKKLGKKLVCTTPQLQKDYSQLVEFRRSIQWRPKLETIREKDRKKLKYARLKLNIKKNSKVKSSHSKSDHKQVKIHKLEREEEKKLKKAKKLENKEKKKERKMEKKLEKKERRLERKKEKCKVDEEKKEAGSKLVHGTVPPPPPPPPPIRTFSSKIKWKKKEKKETKLVHSIPPPPPLPPRPKIRTFSSKIKWKKKEKKEEKKETKLVHSIPPPPPPPPPPSIRTFSSKIKWRKKKSTL